MPTAFLTVVNGLVFALSLIVAIGAQNAFVLRQGLRREHVGAVVAVCAASDVILISAGVGGLGAIVERAPAVLTVARIGGAIFLFCYGALAARRAWRPSAMVTEDTPERVPVAVGSNSAASTMTSSSGTPGEAVARNASPSASDAGAGSTPGRTAGVGAAVATALALTWLNPHVYLDTVVLLGSLASTHGADKWWFGIGALLASMIWFVALGYGARFLRPIFARPAAWRVLDASIAVVMVAIAIGLLRSL